MKNSYFHGKLGTRAFYISIGLFFLQKRFQQEEKYKSWMLGSIFKQDPVSKWYKWSFLGPYGELHKVAMTFMPRP